jgi:dsDNA-specific endonuclease/ATPase MutS2
MKSRQAIEAAVREAREAISDIVREAKRTRTAQSVEAARVALERKAKEVTAALPEPAPLDLARLRDALASRALGVGKGQGGKAKGKPAPVQATERAVGAGGGVAIQTASNTLDVRGQRADEALTELEAFLDRTALEGADTVFVIHGHGTGALRKAVREFLATSPYVERFRPGGAGEGGDGVSVVSLKG